MAVAIPTYERPVSLRKSTVAHLKEGSEVRVYDSSSVATCNENKDMLRTVERDFRAKILYGSPRELTSFTRQLEKAGINPELAKFALTGSAGATRNRILLDTQGEPVLMCDDDIVASNKRMSDSDTAVFRRGSGLRRDPLGFKRDLAIENAHARMKVQIKGSTASQALGLLGADADALWSEARNKGNVVGERIGGQVMAIQVGWVGRPPASAWGQAEALRGGSGLWTIGEVSFTRSTDSITYQPANFIRTFYLGLDNSLPLPPFFPLEKSGSGPLGESSYGGVLTAQYPGCVAVFLPEIVQHVSDEPVRSWELPWTSLVSAIAAKAESLEELTEALLNVKDAEKWIFDLEQSVQSELNARRAAISDGPFGKANVPNFRVKIQRPSEQEVKTLVQYGELIKAWPDMLSAAKIIRGNGVRLTNPL